MSDIEGSDYYSGGESDSESDSEKMGLSKKPIISVKKIGDYENESEKYDDSELDDAENDEEEEDDEDEDDDDYEKTRVAEEDDKIVDEEDLDDEDDEDDDDDDDDIDINEENNVVQQKPKSLSTKVKKTTQLIIEDDDNEDDEYEENYLQKFDQEVNKNYINEFHPECLNHNYDEVSKMTKVVRNSSNIIVDPLHRTLPFLTKYEKARVLGQRAKQIETGAKPLVKVPENIVDSYVIADLELREKKIPFIIKRPIPGGAFEYWNLKDLEIIGF
jgi:DNA-directed RNA polymerase I, II, and III subunit RPABC2